MLLLVQLKLTSELERCVEVRTDEVGMYIYYGKFDWFGYAKNELITIVFPGAFALNDPVCVYWQWTVDYEKKEKTNCVKQGVINSVSKVGNEYNIGFLQDGYYKFEARVGNDGNVLEVTMTRDKGDKDNRTTFKVDLDYSDKSKIPTALIYTGKLNWHDYAKDEMITLVAPAGLDHEGLPVCLYHQWTKNAKGEEKVNRGFNTTVSGVETWSDGEIKAQFDDGYYKFKIDFPSSRKPLTLGMTTTSDDHNIVNYTYTLPMEANDFRVPKRKQALIVRYDVGTDSGIFDVRNMLVDNLAFNDDSIEMLYYDFEPKQEEKKFKARECWKGQQAPTAQRFKQKFIDLIAGAKAGDVRFLYVDAHGSPKEDTDGSGETDGFDEGWKLAAQEDGIYAEVVYDDWISEAIGKNLAPGVNLTILTSSCMGGGMLDTHKGTSGVLLAGVHESQVNVKSLKGLDPWTQAVIRTIKKQTKRNRPPPNYQQLFNEAKKMIRQWIRDGELSTKVYKGPSPDPTKPIPRNSENISHQDPQLVFYQDYIDVSSEKFLYPLAAPTLHGSASDGGAGETTTTRYPRDEL
ncbi:hypothetical protein RUND412_000414 [Rhizina undulata]